MDRSREEIWQVLDSRSIGGIETHVLHLSTALHRAGWPVRVLFLADHGPHPVRERLSRAGVAAECLDGSFSDLLAALKRVPRLVHTHGYKAGILGRLACRIRGIPIVSSFHAGEPGRGRVRLYNFLDGLSAPLATGIAASHDIAGRIIGTATIIPNFVPLPEVAPPSRERAVTFVGRLSGEKGADIFCSLATRFPGLRFDICGDGPLRSSLQATSGSNVRFLGRVDDMEDRWRHYGLLCMPSRHEGMPLAALEAMAHGVPVAAFAVGDLPRLIETGRNGWLAPPGDLDALAKVIDDWSRRAEPARTSDAAEARRTVEERFSPAAVLPRFLSVYDQLGRAAG